MDVTGINFDLSSHEAIGLAILGAAAGIWLIKSVVAMCHPRPDWWYEVYDDSGQDWGGYATEEDYVNSGDAYYDGYTREDDLRDRKQAGL